MTDTVGCNYVKIFGTPGCRNPSWAYSRQYEDERERRAAAPMDAAPELYDPAEN